MQCRKERERRPRAFRSRRAHRATTGGMFFPLAFPTPPMRYVVVVVVVVVAVVAARASVLVCRRARERTGQVGSSVVEKPGDRCETFSSSPAGAHQPV